MNYNNQYREMIFTVGKQFVKTLSNAFNKEKTKRIEFRLNRVNTDCRTYITENYCSYSNIFCITLDINDVVEYSEKNGVEIETATKLLLSHEILHVLLGHFSSKYKNHNKKLLNIAGDLEINQIIGLDAPGLQPEDYNYKPFRDTDYYYDLLFAEYRNKLEEAKSQEKLSLPLSSSANINGDNRDTGNAEIFSRENTDEELENVNNDIIIHSINDFNHEPSNSNQTIDNANTNSSMDDSSVSSQTEDKSLEDKIIDSMIPEDRVINEVTINNLGKGINIEANLKDIGIVENHVEKTLLKEVKTYSIKGFDAIMKKIKHNETDVKIISHDKVNTYYKLNNRRKSDFVLPGKKLINEGVKKKFDSTFTAFIDVSGSTNGSINRDLMNVSKQLHALGGTIVYYTSRIKGICEPDDKWFGYSGNGGTEITTVITEYLNRDYKIDRAYIFTDGHDNFSFLPEVAEKFNVYFIRYNTVEEIYNEKTLKKGEKECLKKIINF